MVVLSRKEIRNLKVGDNVMYVQHMGEFSRKIFEATVIGIYEHHIELDCLANKEIGYHFTTSFAFRDCCTLSYQKLVKMTAEDYLDE